MRPFPRLLICAATLSAAAVAVSAQPVPAPGEVTERIACLSDATQTYSLYLPRAYSESRRWPVLFVFDPRGRGTSALHVFKDAAEEHGWVIVSSDNTASDGPMEPNQRAINAMWDDVPRRYAVDPGRMYAAGFSGTVSVAWALGSSTRQLAGIVGAGGRMPGYRFASGRTIPLFAAAGYDDFNWISTRDIVERIRAVQGAVRFEGFEGEHEWLPPALAREALAWLGLLAMKAGTLPKNEKWISERFDAAVMSVGAHEREGRWADARCGLEATVATFDGLADVAALRERLGLLSKRREVTEALKDERRWDEWETQSIRTTAGTLNTLLSAEDVQTPREIAAHLRVPALHSQAKQPGYKGHAAQRVLNWQFVQLSYYMWRDEIANGSLARAATLQRIAAIVAPDHPGIPLRLAMTYARGGDRAAALRALQSAADKGLTAADAIEQTPAFDGLRETPEYRDALARVRANAAARSPR